MKKFLSAVGTMMTIFVVTCVCLAAVIPDEFDDE